MLYTSIYTQVQQNVEIKGCTMTYMMDTSLVVFLIIVIK